MNKTTPKDFFVHVGATIALYASVIALLALAFELMNRLLPDQLSNYWSANSIIYPISMLVVLVPVLYLLEWIIARDISKIAEKREIWVRKWRIYLTLFLAGATLAGDLVALINVYLNGEISGRFLWKVLIVFVVCSTVFKYYFFSVYESARWTKLVQKTVPWFGIILVVATIVGGFIIVGSPSQQRAVRFDQQRINDLQNIQWQVINYWQKKQTLPVVLSDLTDPLANYSVPVDPESSKAYEYSAVKSSFELCAMFSTDSVSNSSTIQNGMTVRSAPVPVSSPMIVGQTDSWAHTSGRSCFERTIDPALYPPITPVK